MRFSQDFIDKVRDANNIVEIIGQYTELKGSGHRLMGRCPFPDHSDKSPSFSVAEDSQLFFCHGCKKGGNVFNFLQTFQGMSFPESVEYLARRASLPLPEPENEPKRPGQTSRDQKDTLLAINKLAAVYYHQLLKGEPDDAPVRKYLLKRGLNDEIVDKFRLGLASAEWQGFTQHLKAKKAPLGAAETLGLIKPKKSARPDDAHFDLFRERLMFPIFSPTSDVVGFGGRTLTDALPKYVNSSDSPIFHKGRVLYGLHETGRYIRAQDEAIVVEGYMDAISLYSAGIKNVVAILGTAFTSDHAKLLKRYTVNVKMLLDGDEAGISGAERSLPILLEGGLMAKGFVLPEKMDPDDYVKTHGAAQLKLEIERAPELFTLLLMRRWMQGYHGTPSEKVQIVEQAAQVLKGMQNRQLMELYLVELERQLDVSAGWLRQALARAIQARAVKGLAGGQVVPGNLASRQPVVIGGQKAPVEADLGILAPERAANATETSDQKEPETPRVISVKGAPRDEAFVLSLLLHNEDLMCDLIEAGASELLEILTHSGIREVLALALEKYRQRPDSFASLAASLASQIDLPAVITSSLYRTGRQSAASADQKPVGRPSSRQGDGGKSALDKSDERRLMSDYLTAIRKRFLKTQGQVLANQLRDQASPEKLEQFMNIQRNRLSLNRDDGREN